MRRIKKVSGVIALAGLTAAALLAPAADAVVGQVRSGVDRQLPTANNNPSRAKSGPNLAVNPNNPNHIVELHQELETEECEFTRSLDGGASWAGGELQATPGLGFGYRLVGADGAVYGFSRAEDLGSTAGIPLDKPIVGSASTPSGKGYWHVASDGGIFAFGDAGFFGSAGGIALDKPVVGMASTPTGAGYWLVASDGGIFSYGDAGFFGSTGGIPLNKPVVGMASTTTGNGYWLVASDGGIFAFGDAVFFGSTGNITLDKPVVGMTRTKTGNGYWLVASDGGIFAYGDAQFQGSTGGIALNKPIVGMALSATENSYYLVASDGGIFAYGDAQFFGSTGGSSISAPIVSINPGPKTPAFPVNLPGPCDVTGHGSNNIAQRSIAFGSGNNVYITWTANRQLGATGFSVLLSKSTDGGLTYPTTIEIPAMLGGIAPSPDFSRPEIVVDRRTASTDRIFVSARDARNARALVVRSEDAGATFGPAVEASKNNPVTNPAPVFTGTSVTTAGNAFIGARELTPPVLGAAPAGGGNRPLYVGWIANRNGGGAGVCPPNCENTTESSTDSYVVVAKSTDLGATWTRNRAINVRGFISPAGSLNQGSHFPQIATGLNDEVYLTFNQGPDVPASSNCGVGPFPSGAPGANAIGCPSYGAGSQRFQAADHFMNWDLDVWFLRSTNGGTSWSGLKQLNEPKKPGLAAAEITQTRHPLISVAPDGRIDIAWQDRRHWYLNPSDRKGAATANTSVSPSASALENYRCVHAHSVCSEARLGDTYYTNSSDAGATFALNRRLNDRSHNNDVGSDYRFSIYWDYGPAVVALGDSRMLVADMDTRLGNFDADSTDIFLRTVDLNAPSGAIPTTSLVGGGAANLSVSLSQRVQPGGSEAVHGAGFTNRGVTRPVIVNEADMPSALVGGVLARANLGPLLASPAGNLPANVRAEVSRVKPVGAYVIGDATKLSAGVEADLVAAGVPAAQIIRISGGTPADIAAQIAVTMDRRRGPDKALTPPLPAYDAVIIANPNSASASSASALAANRRLPILYVDQNSVPAITSSTISALGVTKSIIVGSTNVISAGVMAAMPNPTRLAGADQFGTSNAVVAESLSRGLPRNIAYVADGNEPMHAALLGGAVGRMGGLLVLAPGGTAANAEATLTAPPLNLRPHIDRIVTSDLSGTAVVANDP